ncbi:NnrS family protein [Neisseria leonii]|uniref:NnrS family protein n=1 Tax=Neisseria leonii TaxID=2995413 RepID=A0A9X4E4W6_9NEIS|nr:NnrS family protein [Neisseria sp. 51.81]MDD9328759.1 NnrS family protein [Neisseria sp. 51.81]
MALIQIKPPAAAESARAYPPVSAQHPLWGMAFRPLYPAAAVFGAFSVLLWIAVYHQWLPQPANPLWHAHEMIWGYTGAVIVAFLLTAVATWTGQPRWHGRPLMVLLALWLGARLMPLTLPGALAGTAFYWLAAALMGYSVWQSRNRRNYIAVAALFCFGLGHALFNAAYLQADGARLGDSLLAGLILAAGFIGLIGSRVIPFFTARRLNTPQAASPAWLMGAPLWLPMTAAALLAAQSLPLTAAVCLMACGIIGLVQTVRWHHARIWREPLLWTLHLGYALTALGLTVLGAAYWLPVWKSAGIHLIAVGGIGLLTLSMMTRTALGHTGRNLYPAPRPMPAAFILMAAAALLRLTAAITLTAAPALYRPALAASGLLFAAALLLFAIRYLPWLLRPRTDGLPG